MSGTPDFLRAVAALTAATSPDSDLCRPFVWAIRTTGAAVTTLGDPLGIQTVCASDALAARLDEIQIDLGEGPCWQAHATGRVETEPDLQNSPQTSWPVARAALRETGIGAVHAFPLNVGRLRLGSVDLYTERPGSLSASQLDGAAALAGIAARQVLRRAFLEITDGGDEMAAGEFSRREVHQASGMVAAQLGIGVDDAMLVLRAHAFGSGRPLRSTAVEVVERRLDFSPGAAESAN